MLLVLIVEIVYQFGAVFVVCEIGEQLKNVFIQIDDLFEQLKWYLFPINVQQLLPIIIANVQQESTINCFGSLPCARETFKKVNKINQSVLN